MVTFDVAVFRTNFKEYADIAVYPDATLQTYFDLSTLYLNNNDYGYLSPALSHALNLMTAHQLKINDGIVSGDNGLIANSTSVGGVSVTVTPPEDKNSFGYWLSTTPYGIQLKALLKTYSIGGFIVGGSPERANFRKFNGAF